MNAADARSHADDICRCGHTGGFHWDFGTQSCSATYCNCGSFQSMPGSGCGPACSEMHRFDTTCELGGTR